MSKYSTINKRRKLNRNHRAPGKRGRKKPGVKTEITHRNYIKRTCVKHRMSNGIIMDGPVHGLGQKCTEWKNERINGTRKFKKRI